LVAKKQNKQTNLDAKFKAKVNDFKEELLAHENNSDIRSFFTKFFNEIKAIKLKDTPAYFKAITNLYGSLHDNFAKLFKEIDPIVKNKKELTNADPEALKVEYINQLIDHNSPIVPDLNYCIPIPKKKPKLKPEPIAKVKPGAKPEAVSKLETPEIKEDKFQLSAETIAEITKPHGVEIKMPELAEHLVEVRPTQIKVEEKVEALSRDQVITAPIEASKEPPAKMPEKSAARAEETPDEPVESEKEAAKPAAKATKDETKEALKEERFSRIKEYIDKDQKKGGTNVSL